MDCTSGSIVVFLALFWCATGSVPFNNALYSIKTDYRLTDFLIKSQQTRGIQTCAHFCSITADCNSINFKSSTNERGLCELNSNSAVQDDSRLRNSPGWSFAYLVKQAGEEQPQPVFLATFTCLGAKDYRGPTSTDGYMRTPLMGKVVLQMGIQLWKVPYTGLYEIVAKGASGGNGTNMTVGAGWRLGGRGAKIKGTFYLKADTQLKILVGQQGGVPTTVLKERPGGGGGGTFVTTSDNVVLLVAGGGGGGASIFPRCDCRDGDPGQSTENGTRYGGTSGYGGKRYDRTTGVNPSSFEGAAGGGFYGDGASSRIALGGTSFIIGGSGGRNNAGASHGGFGGGGAGTYYPGGGGGYSGGGVMGDRDLFAAAGGGGSVNNGTEQENESGVNLGDGKVEIRLIR